jgi:hypothetical protein
MRGDVDAPACPAGGHPDWEGTPTLHDSLQSQADRFLTLDINIDDFWDRVRRGYAHDTELDKASFTFDQQSRLYFKGDRIVVPDFDHLRRQILLWHHAHPWHAHMGISRTAELLSRAFYWPNMHNDIRTFISQCHSCQTMKSPSRAEALLSPLPVPSACWRVVSLDLITQLPRTSENFDSIVVFVDQFSKMVRLIPANSLLDRYGFAKLFFQHIYPHYGLPLGICSDRGSVWNSKFFSSLCAQLGIRLRLTFSYHARANGQVERYNLVIEEAARHFVGPAHDDWDLLLPHLEFSMNNAVSSVTGCTPFSLNRLTPPLSPTELALGLNSNPKPNTAVLHRLYYHVAKRCLEEAKQSMWNDFNRRQLWPTFQVGDLVLVSMQKIAVYHPSFRNKFEPRWLGPCAVLDIVGRTAARIQLPEALQAVRLHDVFHFSVLKHYQSDSAASPTPVPCPPEARTDSGEVFEVASVADYSASRPHVDTGIKSPHYLVRWVGYDDSYNTWLPPDALDSCLEKVADYLFTVARPAKRDKLISQFPRAARDALLELHGRAERTRRSVRGGKESPAPQPYQGKLTRARRRAKSAVAVAPVFKSCTSCACWFPEGPQ